ncbi:MAG: radical SAM protein [Elusimicrobia bacterium]|nr:radical SAM protein [Elusimicrobiota bacterium]
MTCAEPFVDVPRPPAKRIEIHMGARCNNRCVFCMSADRRDRHEPWATLGRIRAELELFRKRGCVSVGFLGGEPTVHPHILESVAHAKKLGYERIAICTNGTRLADRAFCERLVEAGVTRVTISIHSHLAEVEDALTRVPGNHAKKVAGIGNMTALRKAGRLPDNISLNPVFSRRNMGSLKEYVQFFAGLGIDDVRFNFIWPHGEVPADRTWIPTYREAMPHAVRLMLLRERGVVKSHLTFGAVPKCMLRLAGVKGKLLDHLGSRYLDEAAFDPSNDVSMANMEGRPEDRFSWQEVKRDVFKTMSPRCRECRFYSSCDGVWKSYAELYGLGELCPQ